MTQIVAVMDYGSGNLHSVAKAVECSGSCVVDITSDGDRIRKADRIILPGVGAMGDCMNGLKELGLDLVIHELIGRKPLMGICVGMQILTQFGEESDGIEALGIFPGSIESFPKTMSDSKGYALKIPHMGWNQVRQRPHPMWEDINDKTRFYFVHSFRYADIQRSCVVGTCKHGEPFAAALSNEGVFAVQFHPEKSHLMGLKLYSNFLKWDGSC